ncbi:EmrB/QacA subfamily drug resistance transporter [Hydrogenispora ethanolica]|uniref:EmrB/QacA subfamily drug resistance transporter n=1 Tax=Hydrogenispora ethanolica TaxID=1082276 RepID=A0A4R1RZP7_HYDET|nr:MFS transporter [Hydrogenispora ethanolica]TCL72303.1 EmrB/QacA subfamily drug resistance transporter [Hydrogenispora ethanolica]
MTNPETAIEKRRWWILFNVVLMVFMSCLDSSIVNVALPVLATKLRVSMAAIGWVVTSYLIVISATILLFGRLGDIQGKTKVFKFGILLFSFGSLLCGIAGSLPILVVARVLQAVGAAATMSTSQGIITHVFPSHERGRALGISGTSVALGTMVGPPLGGLIIAAFSWHYIFLINVPIGIFTFILGQRIFPDDRQASRERVDFPGAFLFTAAIVLLFGSLTQGQASGFDQPWIIGGFIVAALSLAAFILLERRVEQPLLQLKVFENRLFSLSLFCGFISFIAISCPNIIQPFYLEYVQQLPPEITGLYMMVYPLVLAVVAPVSGYLSDHIGSEFLTFLGLVLTSIGLFLMSTLTEHSSLWLMIVFLAVMSIGNGLFQSPNNSLIMSTVPRTKLGIAGGVNALVRNLGMVVGITFSTTLLYGQMSSRLGRHVADYIPGRADIFIYGMRYVYISAGLICLVGAGLTAYRLYGSKKKDDTFATEEAEDRV